MAFGKVGWLCLYRVDIQHNSRHAAKAATRDALVFCFLRKSEDLHVAGGIARL